MTDIRDLIRKAEQPRSLATGGDERFAGWGLMGLPFASGHILALRRFPTSSLGPGYISLWTRSPEGDWRFYSDVEPGSACPRYFGSALADAKATAIGIEWDRPNGFSVRVPSIQFEWQVECESTSSTRVMNGIARAMPEAAWSSRTVLKMMGPVAGTVLRGGHLGLQGSLPNRQWFIANPRRVWKVAQSSASIDGRSIGEPGPVHPQARLGDFWIPQCGLLAIGNLAVEAFDPARHSAQTSRAPAETPS